jgi:hypothetical protein
VTVLPQVGSHKRRPALPERHGAELLSLPEHLDRRVATTAALLQVGELQAANLCDSKARSRHEQERRPRRGVRDDPPYRPLKQRQLRRGERAPWRWAIGLRGDAFRRSMIEPATLQRGDEAIPRTVATCLES